MDLFSLFVLLHVICAILWVGGGFVLIYAYEVMARKRGPKPAMGVVEVVAMLGPTFFVPVSVLTLVFGAAAAWFGPGFSQLWVILGLLGFAATFLTGLLLIKPRAEALSAMAARMGETDPTVTASAATLLTIVRFDYVVLFVVIATMVLKPSGSDILLLLVMLAILALGAYLTIYRAMRSDAAA